MKSVQPEVKIAIVSFLIGWCSEHVPRFKGVPNMFPRGARITEKIGAGDRKDGRTDERSDGQADDRTLGADDRTDERSDGRTDGPSER